MFTIALVALLVAALLGMKFGAEDRPGFDERRPLA
jgi:hypothetical protein